ncbi:MAG: lanthionine synthetase [Cyanobacteria bacterium RYN_339]|nr:lanthionine synthetase [Cyanobacteria bacterium RYN_339]
MSDAWLAIAALAEPLDDQAAPTPEVAARWSAAVAEAFFARRLAWDGLDGPPAPPAPPLAPAWTGHLASAPDFVGPVAARLLPLLEGFTPAARRQLLAGLDTRLEAIAAQAVAADPELAWPDRWRRWPVLARLMGTAIACWEAGARELLERWAADREAWGASGPVVEVAGGLSDPHHGGRTVWKLGFADGAAVAYKPRPLAIDRAYDDLLAWLAARSPLLAFQRLRVLDRGAYGWLAWVPRQDVATDADAARYFRRAGRLLALLYALHGSDFHGDNLVACGDQPVLVDLETLLVPRVDPAPAPGEPLAEGVAETMFLHHFGPAGDIGGLAERPGYQNLPTVVGRRASAMDHAPEVEAGFAEAYGALVGLRDALADRLEAFADAPIRFLFRNTRHYEQLQQAALHPNTLVDGVARSIALDRLARTFVRWQERPPLWPLIGQERRALEALDVPYFSTTGAGHGLPGLPDVFARSGLEAARTRLAALGPPDLAVQRHVIRLSLALPAADPEPTSGTDQDFLGAALQLGERLAARPWLSLVQHPSLPAVVPGVLGPSLYEGVGGLALFFAALYRATGQVRWHGMALQAVALFDLRDAVQAFGASRVAGLLGTPPPHLDALRVPMLADNEILQGLAGAMAALAALGRPDLAVPAGDALLTRRAPGGGWKSATGEVLPGFAHGVAGIAFALRRVAEAGGPARFAAAAEEAFAFEATFYDPAVRTWRGGSAPSMTAWCHGAPGVALARIGTTDAMLPEALDATVAAPVSGLDFLCCGNFGRYEILLEAGLTAEARRQAGGRLVAWRAREAADRLRVEDLDLSFLRGCTGVGYTLLRLADPALPSVLAWR